MTRVLICGIQKTGNTWVRFVIFNYFNILDHKATKTLTFDELKVIHMLRKKKGFYHLDDGFPEVHHTHFPYNGVGFMKIIPETSKWFDDFEKLIYIYRNPFDTMISYHKFIFNRDKIPYHRISELHERVANIKKNIEKHRNQIKASKTEKWTYFLYDEIERKEQIIKRLEHTLEGSCDMKKLVKLEDFTKYYLEKFINHVKSTRDRADVVLNYDELRKNPIGFKKAIELVVGEGNVDMEIFNKAIEMSSFDNIKKMSDEVNQPYGVGGPLYKGYFCRDGRSNQYKEIMSKELIEYITKRCEEEGLNYDHKE